MVVWTPGCRVMLIGMGEKDSLGHRMARNTGARTMASLSKKKGTSMSTNQKKEVIEDSKERKIKFNRKYA